MLFGSLLLLSGCGLLNLGSTDNGGGQDNGGNTTTDPSDYQELLESIRGSDGREVELSVVDGNISWRYVGDSYWRRLLALDSLVGESGREVEMRVFNGSIQWHYTDEAGWSNLVDISVHNRCYVIA